MTEVLDAQVIDTQALPEALRPEHIEQQALEAAQLSPEDQAHVFAALRQRRAVPDQPTPESDAIDDAIVLLMEHGHLDVVKKLITPLDQEGSRFLTATGRYLQTDDKTTLRGSELYQDFDKLHSDKFIEVKAAVNEHLAEMDEDLRMDVFVAAITDSHDPENILLAPASFWKEFVAFPFGVQKEIMASKNGPEPMVAAMRTISHCGLLQHAPEIITAVASLSDPEERDVYTASLAEAMRQAQSPEVLPLLKYYKDPEAALALALHVSPGSTPYQALNYMRHDFELDAATPYDLQPSKAAIVRRLHAQLDNGFSGLSSGGTLIKNFIKLHDKIAPDALMVCLDGLQDISELTVIDPTYSPANYGYDYLKFDGDALQDLVRDAFNMSPEDAERHLSYYGHTLRAMRKTYDDAFSWFSQMRDKAAQPQEALPDAPPDQHVEPAPKKDYKATAEKYGLDTLFDDLGIPPDVREAAQMLTPDMREEICKAWLSAGATARALQLAGKPEEAKVTELTDEEFHRGAIWKISALYQQATALHTYYESYGRHTAEGQDKNELARLFETFGIVNFVRGTPQDFHGQMQRWEGTIPGAEGVLEPTEHINVACTDDPNTAFVSAAKNFFATFSKKGSFYFEASSVRRVGRAFVQVGERERQAGRNPEADNLVKDVILSGHGNVDLIAFGKKEYLEVMRFAAALRGINEFNDTEGNKAFASFNTYAQHIGTTYRLILDACLVNADVDTQFSINISQLLENMYGVPANASKRKTYGYSLDPDGNVVHEEHVD